ncbi:MAG: hypothetical protein FWE94_05770 [Coriobacteriia bacterium]|nr:hypothetical protein [Coriobacteriia bacterium]
MSRKTLGLTLGLLLAAGLIAALVVVVATGRLGEDAPEEAGIPAAAGEPDVHAAVREMVLRPDPKGTPGSSYTDPEWGSRTINGLPVVAGLADPIYDLSNPDLMVADKGHVLVGRVERCTGTRYLGQFSMPVTDYDVTVLKVIKGSLKAGQEVPLTKYGGISEDGSHIEFAFKGDFLLEDGGVYMFLGGDEPDGKTALGVDSPFGTVPLEDDVVAGLDRIERSSGSDKQKQREVGKALKGSKVVARYQAAARNKIAVFELPPEIRD